MLRVIVYDLSFKGQVFPSDNHSHTINLQPTSCGAILSFFAVSALQLSVSLEQNPTLGQQYTLTCNVSATLGTPTVQWVGPGSSAPIATGGDLTVSSTPPYTLTINPLRPSHAGQYTCRTTVSGDTGTASVHIFRLLLKN